MFQTFQNKPNSYPGDRLQLQPIDVIIPGIGIWLVLKSPKHSQALEYAEHACFVTQEVGDVKLAK